MTFAEVRDWLFARRRMGMKYGLQRINRLMSDLGNPQNDFRTIHVVGTNGKGSTTALLAEICRHLGYRTGRMTSPHLLDFRERISIDRQWIPAGSVLEFVEEYRSLLERNTATFFEVLTALAAWHFSRSGVDWVVAEAGLGGRYDASHVFAGEGTVFTGVQIEHSRILGKTRPLIAAEKVAIAGRKSILIAAAQSADVEEVITEATGKMSLKRLYPAEVSSSALAGEHQRRNAALAVTAAVELLGRSLDEVQRAFDKACSTTRWPGRIDLRNGDPPILFDVAHNPEAVEQLVHHMDSWHKPVPAVIGFLADKPWRKMVDLLAPCVGPVIATTPLSERKLDAADLTAAFQDRGVPSITVENIGDAVSHCRTLTPEGVTMLVTGSFFVVGEAMLQSWSNRWIEQPEGEESQALVVDSESEASL